MNNLSPSNFYTWRKRLAEAEGDDSPETPSFIPLQVMPDRPAPSSSPRKPDVTDQLVDTQSSDSGLSLHVKGGLTVKISQGFHGVTFQRLMRILAPESC